MKISDWFIFWATLGAGIISAFATVLAVIWTNIKTADNYEKELKRQHQNSNMVIIKPIIKNSSIWGIIENLICYNECNRILMLSTPSDGFDFYDTEEMNNQNNKFFSIKNESNSQINSIKIDVSSKLITDSNIEVEEKYSNFVKLLRSNEEIMFRVYTTKQREKLWEELNKKNNSKMLFKCTINYITLANQQICYEYEIEINNKSVLKKIDGKDEITCDAKQVEIKKDEYIILSETTLNHCETASVFRNLQDRINGLDRVKYTYRKIGEAQAEGYKLAGYGVYEQNYKPSEDLELEGVVNKI